MIHYYKKEAMGFTTLFTEAQQPARQYKDIIVIALTSMLVKSNVLKNSSHETRRAPAESPHKIAIY